ncbi:opioid growth factor receptor-like isoform X1 [Sinocyclocheilus rhinocerous]|uniref:Opioid growth factor receptor-like n=2 Tax=Sinocyclocheilus rhinocerous TaxID=307959 RepID=A0A673HAX0_9TELE|nr:PREDICTED: opioid growth factor receptor-like isoform X1 [Sinocyclocheilus rhinocerous]
MDDELLCEYDSTWDTESDGDELDNTGRSKKTRPAFWSNSSSRNLRAAKDMQNYRHGYPNVNEDECPEERMTNLKFYLNEIKSSPDDVSIETFLTEWKTDYKRLERVHSYIQWLFPLREPGVNYMAAELTKKEIQAFRESEEAKSRLLESYELMLGFYGMQLLNRETGEVKRADNWRERFANLERNMHNNLRITRILKSLGELGFEHFQAPLVRFFLEETVVRKTLSSIKRSVLDYFLFAVRDKRERRKLVRFAFQHFEPKDKFVWCPRKIQKRFKKKSEKQQNSSAGSGESAAQDEGHSPYKNKDGEAASEPKHSKPVADLTDAKKQVDSDSVMRVDSEKHSEGSSEDQEPNPDAVLSNGSSVNNGETVSDEPSCAEGQQVIQKPEQAAELSNWGHVAGSRAGSADCDETREEMDSAADSQEEREETASGTSEDRTVTDSPKHNAPTQSEKIPRPGSMRTSVQSESHEKNTTNCNQSNGSEKDEPMDIPRP